MLQSQYLGSVGVGKHFRLTITATNLAQLFFYRLNEKPRSRTNFYAKHVGDMRMTHILGKEGQGQ